MSSYIVVVEFQIGCQEGIIDVRCRVILSDDWSKVPQNFTERKCILNPYLHFQSQPKPILSTTELALFPTNKTPTCVSRFQLGHLHEGHLGEVTLGVGQ